MGRREEKKLQTEKKHKEEAIRIKKLIKSGKGMKEIADIIGHGMPYLYRIKNECIQNNSWFTEEELEEIEMEKEDNEKTRGKKKDEKKHIENVNTLKELIKDGKKMKEIAKIMNYSVRYLYNIKKESIQNNSWFTEEELKEIEREKEEKREKEKYNAKEKKSQNKIEEQNLKKELEDENKIIKEEIIENNLDEKNNQINKYKELYKKYKKNAKKEDKLELNRGLPVSINGREKFFDVLITLERLEVEIPKEDIEMIVNGLYMHKELISKSIIKCLISDANRKGKTKSVEMMINELSNILRYTKFYEPLIEYKRWIKKLKFLPEIKVMKKQGMHNEQIAKELGMSSAEVSILLHKDENEILGGIGIDD